MIADQDRVRLVVAQVPKMISKAGGGGGVCGRGDELLREEGNFVHQGDLHRLVARLCAAAGAAACAATRDDLEQHEPAVMLDALGQEASTLDRAWPEGFDGVDVELCAGNKST